MKPYFVFIFIISAAFVTEAATSNDTQMARSCAGQIMATVQSAHAAPEGALKKPVFNKKADEEFLSYFEKIKTYKSEIESSKTPDMGLAKKIGETLDQSVTLSKKVASKEFALCKDWMNEVFSETKKVCPEMEKKALSQEEQAKCFDKAGETPKAKTKFAAWTKANQKLIQK